MLQDAPYSDDDLRRMRRLILAAGLDVLEWTRKLRRSADFLMSLSPAQAGIVAEQANAIARDPEDIGSVEALEVELREVRDVPADKRLAYISRQIIEIRRQYYTGPLPDDEP